MSESKRRSLEAIGDSRVIPGEPGARDPGSGDVPHERHWVPAFAGTTVSFAMRINDAVFGALLLLLGVVILVHVQAFPKIPGQQVGPALFPGLVAFGLAVCGVLLMVSGYRKRATEPWYETAEWMRSGRHFVSFAAIVGGVMAYVLLANVVGFLIVAPVLLWIWFTVLGVRSGTAIVVATVGTVVIWYAFYKLLRVPLPWGVLTGVAF